MKCYPVIIPTLNRYEHFRACVESLAKCKYADRTELIIGLDYPAKESHFDGYLKIKNYLPEISGFAKVTVFERTENLGAGKNNQALFDYAFSLNECVILSEDDNVFAYTFLEFVNSALETYKDDFSIGSICGFTPEAQYNRNVDVLLSPDASAWGAGRWRSRLGGIYKVDIATGKAILCSFRKSMKVLRTYPMCLAMLIGMCRKNVLHGDVVRTASNIVNGISQAKPGVSLVRNMGHDGSGLHCGTDSSNFDNQELSDRRSYIVSETSTKAPVSSTELFNLGMEKRGFWAYYATARILLSYLRYRISSK